MSVALDSALPGLSDQIAKATGEQQRAAVLAAARMAAMRTGLHDGRIDRGNAAAAAHRFGESQERKDLSALTEELDEIAWGIQERVHAQQAAEAEYLAAFKRARAASALFFALEEQALKGALEGLYEAHHAIGDDQALRALIDDVFLGKLPL